MLSHYSATVCVFVVKVGLICDRLGVKFIFILAFNTSRRTKPNCEDFACSVQLKQSKIYCDCVLNRIGKLIKTEELAAIDTNIRNNCTEWLVLFNRIEDTLPPEIRSECPSDFISNFEEFEFSVFEFPGGSVVAFIFIRLRDLSNLKDAFNFYNRISLFEKNWNLALVCLNLIFKTS